MYARGKFHRVAQLDNDGLAAPGYWQIPNGSVYYDLYTTGGETFMELGYGNANNAVGFRYKVTANASATMRGICCTVKSESGKHLSDQLGLPRCSSTGVTEVTASTTLIPIISIRPKTTFQSKENLILSKMISWNATATQPTRIALILNGTLTGASWADVSTADSCMEVDKSANAISGGTEQVAYYISSGAGISPSGAGSALGKEFLWDRQGSQTGIITLAAIKTGTNDSSVLAALNWEELR